MAEPGPTLPAVGPDGTPLTIPASAAHAVVAAGGHIMGQREAATAQKRAEMEEKYEGTVEGAVAPFVAGAARGASAGLSDVAMSQLGHGVRRRLLEYQDWDPTASLVGEGFGAVGSAAVGNESGIAGLIGKAGAGAERAVIGGLGEGVLARGAGMAARGATEGAIYSAGKAAGDAALQDEALTTEKALAAVGHGALFGAGANVLLGGAGAGLSRLLERESSAASGIATRVDGAAQRESSGLGETLQKASDVKTIKALGGSAGDLRALERNTAGGFQKVAQDIRQDVEATTGKSIGWHNKESLHEYATQRVDELGDKLGGMLKKLDESGSGIAPDVKSFAQKVREELVAPNTVELPPSPEAIAKWQAGKGPLPGPTTVPKPGQSPVVKAAESWLGEVETAFGHKPPTFSEWQQARIGLDKQINYAAQNASPEAGALKQIRGMMEKELEASGESAAKNVGSSFAAEYQATKSLYASVRKAQELTERGVSRELVNNSFGLGATIGAATGMATGGPVGGLAMGLAGKVMKDRGDMFAADLLDRAASLAGVQRLAARTSHQMSTGVSGLLGTKAATTGASATVLSAPKRVAVAAPLGVALSGNLDKDFEKLRTATTQIASNPMMLTEHITRALGPDASNQPKVAAAVSNLMMGDVAFLQSKLPANRATEFQLQPQLHTKSTASASEKAAFVRYAEALDNPLVMLKRAKSGTLTPETVEAVKTRRPEMYEEMRLDILKGVAESTKPVPYARLLQLGVLLDFPTHPSLAPDFVQALQATYAPTASAAPEPPPQNLASLDVASSFMTGTQSAVSEGQDR